MRYTLFATALAIIAVPAAASAQQQQERSPSDFVCALTGEECADDAASDASMAATSLMATDGRPVRVSEKDRGFILAAPRGAAKVSSLSPAAVKLATGGRGVKAGAGTAAVAAPRPLPSVDLRLAFSTGSTQLVGKELREVRNFAAALNSPRLAGRKVRIEGHTDSVGSRASNLLLSNARAKSVAATLIAEGVSPARIAAVGYGFDRPLPGRPARAGVNRRVEAVLTN